MKLHFEEIKQDLLEVEVDKRTECFNFGKGNTFPSLINGLFSNSVTAGRCAEIVAKAVYGNGLSNGDIKINSNQILDELYRVSAREYTKQSNLPIHVSYKWDYETNKIYPSKIKIVPTSYFRVGKSDDSGYSGKYLIYDNWDKTKGRVEEDKFEEIDKFNYDEDVILGQIAAAGGIANYKGQILHICKDTLNVYGVSELAPVLPEALFESKVGVFRSKAVRKGFINTKILAMSPFASPETRKAFKDSLKTSEGVDNAGDTIIWEASKKTEDITKMFSLSDLTSKYDDKIFEYSEKQSEKNIAKALGVPLILLSANESGAFGDSGALLREAKRQVFEDREEERGQIINALNKILSKMKEPMRVEVINPYKEESGTADTFKEAQASLRASVGGGQILLSIQQSVAANTTPISAGVQMVVNLFGYDAAVAEVMLKGKEE